MAQAKHTPGPWTVRETATHVTVIGANGEALFHDDKRIPIVVEDARLIAAAPELLESHEPEREGSDFLDWIADQLVHVYGESENVDFVICLRRRAAKARAAITKALGE